MRLHHGLCAVVVLGVSVLAHASSYTFSFGSSTAAFSGSGVLTTGDAVAPGEYVITAITGTARVTPGGALLNIANLLPAGEFPTPTNGGSFPANDNFLFVQSGVARPDEDGFSFLVDGGAQINLFYDGVGVDALLLPSNGAASYENAALSISPVTATPEPEGIALLGTGMLGAFCSMRRRVRPQ